MQFYFELKAGPQSAALYPGFGDRLTGQPYFVARLSQRSVSK